MVVTRAVVNILLGLNIRPNIFVFHLIVLHELLLNTNNWLTFAQFLCCTKIFCI